MARGTGKIPVHDEAGLAQVANQLRDDPSWAEIPASLTDFRTTVGGVYNSHQSGLGTLPIKNYTTNLWDISDEKVCEEIPSDSPEPTPSRFEKFTNFFQEALNKLLEKIVWVVICLIIGIIIFFLFGKNLKLFEMLIDLIK